LTSPIVFVGAGVASINAIDSLRRQGHDGPIVLMSAERHLPYDRPPLSKDVLLGQAPGGVPLRGSGFYTELNVDLRLDSPVAELVLRERAVRDAYGRVTRAEDIVLATGGVPSNLPIPGANLGGICALRTLDDAIALEERLLPGTRVVIIGGGFIGTEVAAAATERGCEVTLLEALPQPLQNALPELASYVVDIHRQRGVRICGNARVEAFVGSDRVEGVRLADGSVVSADVVVVGVGMRPSDAVATRAGLAVGNGIHVDERGMSSHQGIYAIGDVANVADSTGVRRRTEHWQSAVRSGQRLACVLTGGRPEPDDAVPWFWSDQYGVNIQMAGHPHPADIRILRGDPTNGSATVLFHRHGRLTGVVTMNNGKDVRPASDLIAARALIDPELLAAGDTDLRKLSRSLLRETAQRDARHGSGARIEGSDGGGQKQALVPPEARVQT
jgi:3-phenylpropionate/trans-cinnamate dioxygenase ferredoxin reductase subunit